MDTYQIVAITSMLSTVWTAVSWPLIVLQTFVLWRLLVKAGYTGMKGLIPGYNAWKLSGVVTGKTWAFWGAVAVYMVSRTVMDAALYEAQVVGSLLMLSLAAYHVLLSLRVGKVFGKTTAFSIGLILLPVIFYPVLAFGKSACVGAYKKETAADAQMTPAQRRRPVLEAVIALAAVVPLKAMIGSIMSAGAYAAYGYWNAITPSLAVIPLIALAEAACIVLMLLFYSRNNQPGALGMALGEVALRLTCTGFIGEMLQKSMLDAPWYCLVSWSSAAYNGVYGILLLLAEAAVIVALLLFVSHKHLRRVTFITIGSAWGVMVLIVLLHLAALQVELFTRYYSGNILEYMAPDTLMDWLVVTFPVLAVLVGMTIEPDAATEEAALDE